MAHPTKRQTRASLHQLSLLRKACRALADVSEVMAWGEPTFRHRGKVFAMFASPGTHHGSGRTAIWIKAEAHERDLLVDASPQRYFKPPYMGPSGWIGAYLDEETDWDEVSGLLTEGHRLLSLRRGR